MSDAPQTRPEDDFAALAAEGGGQSLLGEVFEFLGENKKWWMIPIIAVLRDSQNFVHSAEEGIGLHEMQPSRVRPDIEQIDRVVKWLDGWQERRRRANDISRVKLRPPASVLQKPQFGSA